MSLDDSSPYTILEDFLVELNICHIHDLTLKTVRKTILYLNSSQGEL